MSITYTIKSFDTDVYGDISNLGTLTDIDIADIKFEQFVGDEMWLESGELILETYTQITAKDWISLYINNILAEVFSFREVQVDEKGGKYTYILYPIQKTFIKDLTDELINYTTVPYDWSYDILDAEIVNILFKVKDGDGNTQTGTNVSGFQPLPMIKSMIGKSARKGYYIYAANFDGSTISDLISEHGTLIRGTGVLSSDTDQNRINKTFSTDGTTVFDVNWFQIFTLCSLSYNAFIKITPIIVSGTPDKLAVTVDIMPRENVSAGSPISVLTFIERVKENNKYQIDGVLISGNNFDYKLSNWESEKTYKRTVDLSDALINEADYATALYYNRYNSDPPDPFFNTGNEVDNFYSGLVSSGDGYDGECEIIYNDGSEKLLKVLDQVTFNSTTIMINKLSVGVSVRAKFEGVVI
jgi:hypothetical protein